MNLTGILSEYCLRALSLKTTFHLAREREKEPLNASAVLDPAKAFDSHGQSY